MEKAFNEELFEFLQKKLKKELKKAEKESKLFNGPSENYGYICDDLIEALELCDKLLTNDYFERSEKSLETLDNLVDEETGEEYQDIIQKWLALYKKDSIAKKKDMRKLFSIIANNCEDWC